jgi:hypothetical protein
MRNDLNTSVALRLSVVLAYILLASLIAIPWFGWAAAIAAAAAAGLVGLNYSYYRWFAKIRGLGFAARVFPAHLLHHLCNGVSFVLGTLLHLLRRAGLSMPGSISTVAWRAPMLPRAERNSNLDYV